MKAKDIISRMSAFESTDEVMICWWAKPFGMSNTKWVELCKIFDTDSKAAGRAVEQIHDWIQSQRDEIPSLGYDETQGEQNNAKTG